MGQIHESHRISIIGGLILVALTLASGIAVYAVMQRQAESILVKSLEASLQSERRFFERDISAGIADTVTVSTASFRDQEPATAQRGTRQPRGPI